MTFRPILAVALVLTLVTAGCLGTVQAQPDAATTQNATQAETPTISVTASAGVEAAPDLAVVQVAVEATADTADAARGQVANDTDAVRAALRNASVPEDAITTTNFAVQPVYNFSGDSPEIVGYRATHALAIEVSDLDRAGEIVDVAVGAGATRVDSVQFTLSDETRDRLRSQVLTDAMSAARDDADTIASAGDLTITGVQQVSTVRDAPIPPVPVFERTAADAGTTFSPGPVTVSATVSVTYAAESN